jgi:hypothetical protein
MKTLLISVLAVLYAMVIARPSRFDHLDLTSDKFDISWEDITDDLWP